MARLKSATGTDLSARTTDELAREAEAGYDLSRSRRVRVGRPALGAGGASPRLGVRVDPELAEALRDRARREGRSVSDLARAALREYVRS